MTGARRAFDFQVSEYFFKLTSESIRLFSNRILRHCSLEEVVEDRVERVSEIPNTYEVNDLHAHLRLIPADGDVELSITILETSAESIDAAIPAMEQALGQPVRFVEAISVMLFDVLIECNATEVLTKLGLSSKDAREYKKSFKRRPTNVVPIR